MKCTGDVVAYSTGSTTDTTAHASTTAYGAVKYDGSSISVNSSGQLYAVKSYGCDGSTILANDSNNFYVNSSAFPNNMNLSTSVGGVLGLTKTSNSQRWDIAGYGTLQFYYKSSSASNGTLEAQIDTDGSYIKNSDIRLKNISGTENSILNKIDNITPIYYSMKSDSDKKECLGLSAQEVQATLPIFVHTGSDGYLGLDYAGIGAVVAVEGCKELCSIIKTQQSKIDELEKRIQALENK